MKIVILGLSIALLVGCATQLTEQGSKVLLLTSSDQAAHCEQIKIISTSSNTGSDDLGNATRKAINDAAAAGANAFLVTSSGENWLSGASVVGSALRCP